jgi:uncharacterized protein
MRTSSYVVYVRLPKSNEYLLVHGYTGAVDVVSKRIADSLRFGRHDGLSDGTISTLKRRGYLTDISVTQEREHVSQFAAVLQKRERRTNNYAFVVAYECNFRCAYCYEKAISKDGRGWSGETFSGRMVDAAYAAVDQMSGAKCTPATITLYGGEPLLQKNAGVVRCIVSQGASRGYDFCAITNGYELDSFTDLIGGKFINHLQITIDGDEQDHDGRRILYTGEGTFLKVFSNVSLALSLGAKVSLRVNVDEDNIEGLEDLAVRIRDAGWQGSPNFKCQIAYTQNVEVVPRGVGSGDLRPGCLVGEVSIGGSPFRRLGISRRVGRKRNESDRLSAFAIPGDTLKDHVKAVIQSGKGFRFRGTYCGASTGNFIFDPRGDIYTCLESVGTVSAKVGEFVPFLRIESDSLSVWRERTIGSLKSCSKCKYSLFCGGGCAVFAKRKYGSMKRSYCDGFPALFQASARSAYEESVIERR